MAFDLLPALHLRARHATICVRVSRKWEYREGTNDGPTHYVDLVLVDAKVLLSSLGSSGVAFCLPCHISLLMFDTDVCARMHWLASISIGQQHVW